MSSNAKIERAVKPPRLLIISDLIQHSLLSTTSPHCEHAKLCLRITPLRVIIFKLRDGDQVYRSGLFAEVEQYRFRLVRGSPSVKTERHVFVSVRWYGSKALTDRGCI